MADPFTLVPLNYHIGIFCQKDELCLNFPITSRCFGYWNVLNVSEADVTIHLYQSEQDALSDACDTAAEYMRECGCDDPSNSQLANDYYREVLAATKAKDFRVALETYSEWNGNIDYDDYYKIYVYDTQVNPDSKIHMGGQNTCAKIPLAKAVPDCGIPQKKEVSCRVCGTSLYEGESPCWKCGSEHST